MNEILRKLAWLFQRSRKEAELREELQFHLEEEEETAAADGLTPRQAQYAARREFGNVTLAMEDARAAWGWTSLERLWQDLRYAARMLCRYPGFAAAAILSLALGIGANTAIFSLLNAVVLRPLPVVEPQQLVRFTNTLPLWETGSDLQNSLYAYPQFERFRARSQNLSGVFAGTSLGNVSLGFRGTAGIADADAYSDNFFAVLGVTPQRGRLFSPGEDRADASVAVLSDRYWRDRFGADPSVVGSAITINRLPFTVVGITPPEFLGVAVGQCPDVWVPLRALDQLQPDKRRWTEPFSAWMQIAGRLRPGVARERAQAELDAIHRNFLAEQLPVSEAGRLENVQRFVRESRLLLEPAASGLESGLRERYSFPLKLVMGVAGIVLLVACANIANLLLARASSRRREIAIRLALGAGHARLVCQFLTESMVLALAGGLLALPLSSVGSTALLRMISTGGSPLPLDVTPDWRVFSFVAALSLLTGLLFGLAPALRSTRIERASRTADRSMVVVQVALSVVLVTGAGLLLRTLQNLWKVNIGYDRENVLMVSVDARLAGYTGQRAGAAYSEILRRLQGLPGVRSASASVVRPVDNYFNLLDQVNEIDGRRLPAREAIRVAWNAVSPGYFSTVMTPLLAGRDFDLRDNAAAPKVVIVNQSLARSAFPNQNPLGHRLGDATVVGVVKDSLYSGARDLARPVLYHPLFQHGPQQEFNWGFVSFELRYGSLAGLLNETRRTVAGVDPNLPVFRANTLVAQAERSLMRERLLATLSTFFGALALLLACVGLYGVTSYSVARRTTEIGIRLALGARRTHMIWLVLRETLWLTLAGIAAGVPLALLTAQFAKSLLFGVGTADFLTFAATIAILAAVAALAAYFPVRHALRVDPIAALRCD